MICEIKVKRVFLAAGLLLVSAVTLTLNSCDTSNFLGKLDQKQTVNLGDFPVNSVITGSYVIKNRRKVPLELSVIRSSCSCIVPLTPPETIPPERNLTVHFKVRVSEGPQNGIIRAIDSAGTVIHTQDITFSGFKVVPTVLDLGRQDISSSPPWNIPVLRSDKKISGVLTNRRIQVLDEQSTTSLLAFKFSPDIPLGTLSETVIVLFDNDDCPPAPVKIEAEVVDQVYVQPATISIYRRKYQELRAAELTIRSFDESPIQLINAIYDNSMFSLSTMQNEDNVIETSIQLADTSISGILNSEVQLIVRCRNRIHSLIVPIHGKVEQ